MLPRYPKINIEPVKGVRLLPVKTGTKSGQPPQKPYGVIWDQDGRRPSAFFESLELLERKVGELNSAKRAGNMALIPDRDELAEWRAFKAKIGTVSPLEIYAGWKAWLDHAGHPTCEMTVGEAVDEYMAEQKKRLGVGEVDPATGRRKGQSLDENSYRQKRVKLARFRAEFELYKLDEVSGDDIEEWIDKLEMVKAPESFNDHVKQVRSLYLNYDRIVPRPPTADVELRDDLGSNVRVMPVADIAKLLDYAREFRPWILPRLASEVFCGVRFTTAAKLTKENVRLDTKTLILPKRIMKTKSAHNLQCMPPCYWEWVNVGYNDQRCWSMNVADYMHAKSSLFESAKVTNPHNGLRHTMASRHVAAFNDPGLVARLLCHRDQERLWQTYLGVSTAEDGKQHFRLLPVNAARAAAGEHLQDPDQISAPRGSLSGPVGRGRRSHRGGSSGGRRPARGE